MSRKDYIAIAAAIKMHVPPPLVNTLLRPVDRERMAHRAGRHNCASDIANELANLFAKENDRFDRDRFLTACGVQS